jgi:hypothetical protein
MTHPLAQRGVALSGGREESCPAERGIVAALFVEPDGVYAGVRRVELWDESRDARFYRGPHPVICHPPCQRWGRYWHGSPRKPHQYRLGDDDGCFAAALRALIMYGGVIEHPAHSRAWDAFNLPKPDARGGWKYSSGLAVCHVEQGHYGHIARKATWLLACRVALPELIWGPGPQRLPAYAVARYGYAKARRIGVMAAIGGKDKTKIRNATPPEFRDVLLSIAGNAGRRVAARLPNLCDRSVLTDAPSEDGLCAPGVLTDALSVCLMGDPPFHAEHIGVGIIRDARQAVREIGNDVHG